ncbi:unnamed protein product, partial [marine sediment metagenome]
MSSFAIKLNPSVKELRIWLLKISFGVLFVVFGIFGVFSDVWGATIFEDDFEAYDLGLLVGQGDWLLDAGDDKVEVQSEIILQEAKAIKLPHYASFYAVEKTGSSVPIGSLGFSFLVSSELEYENYF